jgi:hypothetical protein
MTMVDIWLFFVEIAFCMCISAMSDWSTMFFA